MRLHFADTDEASLQVGRASGTGLGAGIHPSRTAGYLLQASCAVRTRLRCSALGCLVVRLSAWLRGDAHPRRLWPPHQPPNLEQARELCLPRSVCALARLGRAFASASAAFHARQPLPCSPGVFVGRRPTLGSLLSPGRHPWPRSVGPVVLTFDLRAAGRFSSGPPHSGAVGTEPEGAAPCKVLLITDFLYGPPTSPGL